MFRRILVANRGEIAARVIRACKALGIESVAVYSDADRESPHLAEADRTVCIGPARSTDSYLRMDAILQAALQTDCQALHPGYGFLAENDLFARRCLLQKTTFIGPPPRALALMGDKSEAKRTMRRLGLPTIPGSEGRVADAAGAARIASETGYPVLLKASAGGGGRGMRVARSERELLAVFPEAGMEAEKAFGDPSLYVEKLIEKARHIEFQVLVDSWGCAVHLGERECSIQRSHQKLVEESPSPAVGALERDALGRRAAAAVAAAGYVGAGTVEFLRDGSGAFHFMEVNARLQVEHPVTEMVTGIDLVEKQIRIAAGEALGLTQEDVRLTGHALELRINAEDPDDGFRPDPGTVTLWEPPGGSGSAPLLRFAITEVPGGGGSRASAGSPDEAPRGEVLSPPNGSRGGARSDSSRGALRRLPGADSPGPGGPHDEARGADAVRLRLDSHVLTGYTVPPFYDSLLGKLILHTPDRPTLIAAAERAVAAFRVEGIKTTLPLHARVLAFPAFRSGDYGLETLAEILNEKKRPKEKEG